VGRRRVNLLLDTHVFAWWVSGDSALSEAALREIARSENNVFVSPVSAFEMATKFRIGKWDSVGPLVESFDDVVRSERFEQLPIRFSHAKMAGLFQVAHRDPFDRLLAAQGLTESMTLISADPALSQFGVRILF
jgi:PIN domain nuclease of toxin-antitoxin system